MIVPCPYCRCASTVSMYQERSGEIRLDHDCPKCGHRSLGSMDIIIGCLRDMAGAKDIEPMYRTPEGAWYGLISKRTMRVTPTSEGECDLFDPKYDHIGDATWVEE